MAFGSAAGYEKWGTFVAESIEQKLKPLVSDRPLGAFLKVPVIPRTKTVSSFVDKAFHRKKYERPYEEVEDKVGIRFVVLLTDNIKIVERAIIECGFPNQRIRTTKLSASFHCA
jgi:putative GTP pyrophosphokinase